MSNPMIVLAPDAEKFLVQLFMDVWSEDDSSAAVFLGLKRMTEPEARHLRDWLCEQFGLPETCKENVCGCWRDHNCP
jgi:hypothetical protein